MVEGKVRLAGASRDWGVLGERMNVFEKMAPHCLYLPNGVEWKAAATTDYFIAICSAPGKRVHKARRIGPVGITLTKPDKRRQRAEHQQYRDGARGLLRHPPRNRGFHAGRPLVLLS
jgi:5-deoxy-D-glucuronate isomerase